MPGHPLAEVFGFPVDNLSSKAIRYRRNQLCPYNNRVPNCTKDKANDPLGVCSIYEQNDAIAITCPIRFRQDWIVTDDAALFFFPESTNWTSLTEIRLNDKYRKSAGNIDIVLAAYDKHGDITDFGSLEIQAVYISGNIRRPFQAYMQNPDQNQHMIWSSERNYPRPDYLSSSRKRLVPQLLYKGGILKSWGKKQAVAIHKGFYETLPVLTDVAAEEADMAWLIYDLVSEPSGNIFQLQLIDTVYTLFEPALNQITVAEPGELGEFIDLLQDKLDAIFENEENPPDALTLADLL